MKAGAYRRLDGEGRVSRWGPIEDLKCRETARPAWKKMLPAQRRNAYAEAIGTTATRRAFTLNLCRLGVDGVTDDLKLTLFAPGAKAPASRLRRKIESELAARGLPRTVWLRFEVSDKGLLHVHGVLAAADDQCSAAREALEVVGKALDPTSSANVNRVDQLKRIYWHAGWVGYSRKDSLGSMTCSQLLQLGVGDFQDKHLESVSGSVRTNARKRAHSVNPSTRNSRSPAEIIH